MVSASPVLPPVKEYTPQLCVKNKAIKVVKKIYFFIFKPIVDSKKGAEEP